MQKRVRPEEIEITEVGSSNPAVGKALCATLRVEVHHSILLRDYDTAHKVGQVAELEAEVNAYLRKAVMNRVYGDLKTFARQARMEFLRTPTGTFIGHDHPGIKLLDMLLKLADEEPAAEQTQEVSS
jgi:hypothetical protein